MPINDNSAFTARFNMVFQPQERAMLQALAADAGLNESALIRQWIGEAYAARFGKKKPGEPVPKYNAKVSIEAKSKTRKR
jgi:hypothetical protein